ncbi:chemotaxis protein CheB [Pedobacter sp. HMF7647]|uniref:protein-glutamate methylesterase n=1 Tax=Hufsiella arboris TaxID=2695275 RepID=A0A7K1YB36_9SPHI|nr:chemotaxis protein CheB [Hufsiella arboris]MXV51807.1 chemotaxis protein CheB [Hufsiella arboris]
MAKNGLTLAKNLLLIGGSAGSLEVILQFLPFIQLGPDLAIVMVLHRKAGDDSPLVELLTFRTHTPVKEAEEKEPVNGGVIYVAPADYHLLVERNLTFSLDFSEKVNYSRPSIDLTFQTAAEAPFTKLTCLLLSGANEDGSAGVEAVKLAGGTFAVQDPSTAEVFFMPQKAINRVKPDFLLKPKDMSDFINSLNS